MPPWKPAFYAMMASIAAVVALISCGDSADAPFDGLAFGAPGAISGASGRGSFAFGVATAATQIEDANPGTDWAVFTAAPPAGLGRGTPVGDAAQGYSRALDDVALIEALNADVYRFSVSWARVEPQRDVIDEAAIAHYRAVLDRLAAGGIRPMITVHHFSSPAWVDDPRDVRCASGPTDANLCGWDHPTGASDVIAELAEHAALLAQRYGDRVDDWATVNEPINYLFAAYGGGIFPPGKLLIVDGLPAFAGVVRNYLRAHVAIYDAIRQHDTVDADGDGVAAHIGFTLSVAKWVPARNNEPSTNPDDHAAAERLGYLYHRVLVESLRRGAFDPGFDEAFDEPQPDWTGKLDWLGVQYYFRAGVTGARQLTPGLDLAFCFGPLDAGACLPPEDASHWVPTMHYEFWAPGLYELLADLGARWPDLPLTVTESGIATESGPRRVEHIVRSLEQIHRAIADGVDVRGYYHWSLMDNFEWAEGYGPRFGLYRVDRASFARTPTEGATVFAEIAGVRGLSSELRALHGGLGPMSSEPPAP